MLVAVHNTLDGLSGVNLFRPELLNLQYTYLEGASLVIKYQTQDGTEYGNS